MTNQIPVHISEALRLARKEGWDTLSNLVYPLFEAAENVLTAGAPIQTLMKPLGALAAQTNPFDADFEAPINLRHEDGTYKSSEEIHAELAERQEAEQERDPMCDGGREHQYALILSSAKGVQPAPRCQVCGKSQNPNMDAAFAAAAQGAAE